jgi:hypothetical protein
LWFIFNRWIFYWTSMFVTKQAQCYINEFHIICTKKFKT